MTPTEKTPHQQLVTALVKGTSRAAIVSALEMADPDAFDAEFWTIQAYTAQHRFFAYCRAQMGLDLAAETTECSDEEALALARIAESFTAQGGRYADVRQWFLSRGRFEHALAYQRRHEREAIANASLRVLVVLNPKGAQWLAFDEATRQPRLVERMEDAHHFPVEHVTEKDKAFLLRMAEKFEYLKSCFDVRDIKVLYGQRPVSA